MSLGTKRILFRHFNVGARGEAPKAMLAIAKLPFEEEVIEWSDWLQMRSDRTQFPQGTLPVMHYGDVIFGDSFSSLAFVAKVGGFVPDDPIMFAQCAQVQQCIESIYTSYNETSFMDTMREEDPEKKKQLRGKWTDTIRTYLAIVNDIKTKNAASELHVIGSNLTYADILIYNTVCHLQCGDIDYFDSSFLHSEFPKLVAIKDHVFSNPEIAARRASGNGWQK
jgi:hypothetical protein